MHHPPRRPLQAMLLLLLAVPSCVRTVPAPTGGLASRPTSQPTAAASQPLRSVHGDSALLRRVAELTAANRRKITTWQGEVTITRRWQADRQGPFETESHRHVAFAFDATIPAEQSLCTVESTTRKPGQDNPEKRTYQENGCVKDNCYYELMIWPGTERQLVIHSARRARPALRSGHFSPLWYLTWDGQEIDTMLGHILDTRRARPDKYYRVTRDESRVVLEYIDRDNPMQRFVFDLDQAGCLVEERRLGAAGSFRCRRTWQQVNGVWIPKSFDYESTSGQAVTGHETRHLEWTNQAINKPLPPNTFTWDALGLQPGDTVSDAINRTAYEYSPDGVVRGRFGQPTTRGAATHPVAE